MRVALTLFFISISALSVEASGVQQWCIDAYEAGDIEKAEKYANQLSFGFWTLKGADVEVAEDCLKRFTGEDLNYDRRTRTFLSGAELERSKELEKLDREKERVAIKEREAADAAQREMTRQALERVERRQAEQRATLVERLSEACNRLYRINPDEAVLNQRCFDVFWQSGLPQ